jgi:fructokinase (EC 2.7.1.4)
MTELYGAIEAGGTKFVCAVGSNPEDLTEVRFSTTSPSETLARAIAFFDSYRGRLAGLGVGSFGPIDLDRASPRYGYITSTPKPGWSNTDVVGTLANALDIPVAFDTDVNAAALAEGRWGAGVGLTDFIYLTIGTGIGGGVICNGRVVHGMMHPELGHSFLAKHPEDTYRGRCPFHGDACFEGLAAGPAIEERWQKAGIDLVEDHPAWALQAHYVAQALVNFICTLSPQKIILGGGVMEQQHLLSRVKAKTHQLLNGYIQAEPLLSDIDSYIVVPDLGNQAGVLGGFVLAEALLGIDER